MFVHLNLWVNKANSEGPVMPAPQMSATQVVQASQAVEEHGSIAAAAAALNLPYSTLRDRYYRSKLEVEPKIVHPESNKVHYDHAYSMIGFTDAHVWPGEFSPAFYILCQILEHVQPEVVVDGGDFFDGAGVSRHPPLGNDPVPTLPQELDACREASALIWDASKGADHLRIPGNHGDRIARYVAANAPQFGGQPGTRIEDFFGDWTWAQSHLLNDGLFITHNYKGGIHAGHNNALWAGCSVATGHDHKLKAYPIDDFRGRRWGIHMGTLQNIYHPAFAYMGHKPRDWASGLVYIEVLPDGRVYPELIYVEADGTARWRGRTWRG